MPTILARARTKEGDVKGRRTRAVWSWAVDDLIRAEDVGPSSTDYRWQRWVSRAYATDIFNSGETPAVHDLLIGVALEGEEHAVAVGQVSSLAGVSTSRVRVTVSPICHLDPLTLGSLGRSKRHSRQLRKELDAQALRPRLLRAATAREVLEALENARPELRDWLEALELSGATVTGDEGQRLREERDAVDLGLEMADLRLPDSQKALHVPTSDVLAATSFLNPDVFEDNEDDLLFADLRRFDTHGVLTATGASTSRYTDGEVTLLIANVNRKPVEHLLGVDLLYWDQTAHSFTLLQYKRLTRTGKTSEDDSPQPWRYTRRDDLNEQLKKMARIEVTAPTDPSDWRLTSSPFWFKFVRGDAYTPNDREVLLGLYVPADYLRSGMEADAFTGPKGGFALHSGNVRFINRAPFIHLVRRHFTGSTRATSEEIAEVINRSPDRELVVVAKKTQP